MSLDKIMDEIMSTPRAKYEAQRREEIKKRNKSDYKTNCADCGRFVEKNRWVDKKSTCHPLCYDCASNYDDYYG